jgi:hypothetical protein
MASARRLFDSERRRRIRILHLHPIRRAPRPIRRISSLRHDPSKPMAQACRNIAGRSPPSICSDNRMSAPVLHRTRTRASQRLSHLIWRRSRPQQARLYQNEWAYISAALPRLRGRAAELVGAGRCSAQLRRHFGRWRRREPPAASAGRSRRRCAVAARRRGRSLRDPRRLPHRSGEGMRRRRRAEPDQGGCAHGREQCAADRLRGWRRSNTSFVIRSKHLGVRLASSDFASSY